MNDFSTIFILCRAIQQAGLNPSVGLLLQKKCVQLAVLIKQSLILKVSLLRFHFLLCTFIVAVMPEK